MIEAVAGDVQRAILAVRLQSLETEQMMSSPAIDAAICEVPASIIPPWGAATSTAASAPLADLDPIVHARDLVARELGEGAVFASGSSNPSCGSILRRACYIPTASRVRYAHTDGARNQGVPR